MGFLLAKSGRLGSSHKDWFSFWGPRQPGGTTHLGLGHVREKLCVQELFPESPVERLGKAALLRRSWFDVGRLGITFFTPTLERVGDELEAVVAADVVRCRVAR